MSSSTPNSPPTTPSSKTHQEAVATALKHLIATGEPTHAPHTATTSSPISSHFATLHSHPTLDLEAFSTAWHLGNYVLDRLTRQKTFEPMSIYVRLGMHFLYYGPAQSALLQTAPARALLKQQSERIGALYDSPAGKAHIRPFIDSFGLRESLADLAEPNPDAYPNFNAFFARELKPSARPIADPEDALTVSCPADCRLTVFPTTDQATKYWIKGRGFTLAKLLHSEPLARELAGGAIAIARLAPQDYHRWHSPIDGVVESISDIAGTYYTVNPQAVTQEGPLDVLGENKRSVMVLRRKGTGARVVVVAVGAMLVGSLRYGEGVGVGAEVGRGQCLGAFYYGGSTVVVLFPQGEVVLDGDLVGNSVGERCETLMRVGWRMARGPVAEKGGT